MKIWFICSFFLNLFPHTEFPNKTWKTIQFSIICSLAAIPLFSFLSLVKSQSILVQWSVTCRWPLGCLLAHQINESGLVFFFQPEKQKETTVHARYSVLLGATGLISTLQISLLYNPVSFFLQRWTVDYCCFPTRIGSMLCRPLCKLTTV